MLWKKAPPKIVFDSIMSGRRTDFSLRQGWLEVYEKGRYLGLFDGFTDFEDWARKSGPGRRYLLIFRCANPLPSGLQGITAIVRWHVRTGFGRPTYRTFTAAEGRHLN